MVEVGADNYRFDFIRVLNRADVLVLVRGREFGWQHTRPCDLCASEDSVRDPSGRSLAEQLHQLVDYLKPNVSFLCDKQRSFKHSVVCECPVCESFRHG